MLKADLKPHPSSYRLSSSAHETCTNDFNENKSQFNKFLIPQKLQLIKGIDHFVTRSKHGHT